MVALGSTLIDTAKFGSNDVTAFYLGSNEAWTAGEPAELIKPTGIANTGGSASIGTNGQVTFSGVTSLSLNGVFSADFDNYVISFQALGVSVGSNPTVGLRYRTSGSDASGTDYTWQNLRANSTTVNGNRYTSQTYVGIGDITDDSHNGFVAHLYGPALAQPTASRSVLAWGLNNATIDDKAGTHSLSTSYDGFTIFVGVSSMTGYLQVYGLRT